MANYYTQSVLTEPVYLTEDLYVALAHREAELNPQGDSETALDGIVHERPPLTKYYVTFPTGWLNACDDVDEFLVEYVGLSDEEVEKISDEVRRLVVMDEHDLLHEILKVNPFMEMIEMQSAWTCSAMRLDGFGGSGLMVNRKGYLYLTSSNYEVGEDGVIEPSGGFKFWEVPVEAT